MLVVRINSRGLPRGIYFARIKYRVNGRRGTRHHGFRFCYGNPKGARRRGAEQVPGRSRDRPRSVSSGAGGGAGTRTLSATSPTPPPPCQRALARTAAGVDRPGGDPFG